MFISFIDIYHFLFRSHKESMKRLKKLLAKSSKEQRRRQTLLNMQITLLAWVVEFLGFFIVFLGTFILGHENAIVTLSLQTLTMIIFFIVCPSVYLVNSSHVKNLIVNSQLYVTFLKELSCCNLINDDQDDDRRVESENENED